MEGIAWRWQSIDGALLKAPLAQEWLGPTPPTGEKNGSKRMLLVDSNSSRARLSDRRPPNSQHNAQCVAALASCVASLAVLSMTPLHAPCDQLLPSCPEADERG